MANPVHLVLAVGKTIIIAILGRGSSRFVYPPQAAAKGHASSSWRLPVVTSVIGDGSLSTRDFINESHL